MRKEEGEGGRKEKTKVSKFDIQVMVEIRKIMV
jgi:hypothetical protein